MKNLKMYTSSDWEKVVEILPNGKEVIICENHKLDAEDVLFALGYRFEIEGLEEDYEPLDIDSDFGFDPYMGCFSDDC